MIRPLSTICVTLLVAAAFAAEAPKPSPADAERLVQQLGSTKHAEREAAARALDVLGVAAMPALREGVKSSDAEVSRRAGELLEKLVRQAESVTALQATKVKLKANNAPLADVVRDLSKQAKIRFQLAREPVDLANRSVTLDTGEMTFWEALDALCRAAKISIRPNVIDLDSAEEIMADAGAPPNFANLIVAGTAMHPDETIVLQDGSLPETPTAYVGGVRIRLVPDRWVNRDRKPGEENRWTLEVLSEPRIRWQNKPSFRFEATNGMKFDVSSEKAEDAPVAAIGGFAMPAMAGRVMFGGPAGVGMSGGAPTRGIGRHQMPVFVKAAPGANSNIPELKGSLAGSVMAPPAAIIAIADVSKDKPSASHKDGTKLSVREYERADDGTVTLKVEVERPGGGMAGGGIVINRAVRINAGGGGAMPARMAQLMNSMDNDESFKLFDEKGKPFEVNVTGSEIKPAAGAMNVTFTLTCNPPAGGGQPRKLELHGPRPANVESTFTLKNVPTP